ncbi:MAG: hypothetical protein OXQ89_10285 [Rhodospirillaceae bacterium]|nr:hypothetical protein [Rhodospirillaceae bacterium]
MARFLRDKRVSNITLDEAALGELYDVFQQRSNALRNLPIDENKIGVVHAVIRFDGKGYRVFSCDELLAYFRGSSAVERITVSFQTPLAVNSNNMEGSFIELRLERDDPTLCVLTVSSDNADWVDASFQALDESLSKVKNPHAWSRSHWFGLLIQLSGVFLGFVVSLWAAAIITPKVPMENAFLIVFLFVLLLVSNIWGYLHHLISTTVTGYFPNIEFVPTRKNRYRWLMQTVIGGIVVAVVIYLLNRVFLFVGNELAKLFTEGP